MLGTIVSPNARVRHAMLYTVLAHLVTFLLDLLCLARQSEHAKDLEILTLRQQLRILQRAQARPVRPARWEKAIVATCVRKLKAMTVGTPRPWRQSVLLLTPDTVLRWHRDGTSYGVSGP